MAEEQAPERPVLIGRDTRLSGPMLEAALIAGVTSVGRDVVTIGIAPTPAVASIVRHVGAAAGIVISASHNPIEDNGIKIFASDGYKLSDETEARIEAMIADDRAPRPPGRGVGVMTHEPELIERYAADLIAAGSDLSGLTVVVDAAYGAPLIGSRRTFCGALKHRLCRCTPNLTVDGSTSPAVRPICARLQSGFAK